MTDLTKAQIKALLRPRWDTHLNETVELMYGLAKAGGQPVPTPAPTSGANMGVAAPVLSTAPVVTNITPLDFTGWAIAGDTDAEGGFTGNAKTWYPVPLDQPWLKVSGNVLTFTARVDGARTSSNTKYARSELREMINGQKAAWKPSQGGTLMATCSVEEVPVKADGNPGRLIIGQIHGKDDELCRLYYDDGKLYFVNDKAGDAQKETTFQLNNPLIPIGAQFSYGIKVSGGKITVWLSPTWSVTEPIGPFWANDDLPALYFKAGVYLGAGKEGSGAGTIGTGRGVVKFYGVPQATH